MKKRKSKFDRCLIYFRLAEEERIRQEELEAKLRAEEEARRLKEEARLKAEEEKRVAEELKRLVEENVRMINFIVNVSCLVLT